MFELQVGFRFSFCVSGRLFFVSSSNVRDLPSSRARIVLVSVTDLTSIGICRETKEVCTCKLTAQNTVMHLSKAFPVNFSYVFEIRKNRTEQKSSWQTILIDLLFEVNSLDTLITQ